MNRFDTINDAIEVIQQDLTNHTTNYQNPHKVSAEQIGLGNVDNTSDADKPVSTAQQTAINSAVSSGISSLKIRAMTSSDYEAIEEKDENTVYIITDQQQ